MYFMAWPCGLLSHNTIVASVLMFLDENVLTAYFRSYSKLLVKFGENIQTTLKGDTVSPQPLPSSCTASSLPIKDGMQSRGNIRSPFRELIKKMPGERNSFLRTYNYIP